MEVDTEFEPRTNGFGFTNSFPGGRVLAELVNQDRVSELVGLKVPRALRPLSDLAAGEDFWGTFGLCGGMSWAALDRFRRGERPPTARSAPGSEDPLFRELVGRQADSMKGRTLIERCIAWQALPDRAPWWMIWSKGVGRLTTDHEWPKLRAGLDAGEPTSIVLIRARGFVNPSTHHQVVAIGYEVSDDRTVDIRLYDSNHPGSRPTVPIDPPSRSAGPRQSTGEPFRGFFVWTPTL